MLRFGSSMFLYGVLLRGLFRTVAQRTRKIFLMQRSQQLLTKIYVRRCVAVTHTKEGRFADRACSVGIFISGGPIFRRPPHEPPSRIALSLLSRPFLSSQVKKIRSRSNPPVSSGSPTKADACAS